MKNIMAALGQMFSSGSKLTTKIPKSLNSVSQKKRRKLERQKNNHMR